MNIDPTPTHLTALCGCRVLSFGTPPLGEAPRPASAVFRGLVLSEAPCEGATCPLGLEAVFVQLVVGEVPLHVLLRRKPNAGGETPRDLGVCASGFEGKTKGSKLKLVLRVITSLRQKKPTLVWYS